MKPLHLVLALLLVACGSGDGLARSVDSTAPTAAVVTKQRRLHPGNALGLGARRDGIPEWKRVLKLAACAQKEAGSCPRDGA